MTWGVSLDPTKDVKAYVDAQLCRARGGGWGSAGCTELVKLVQTQTGEGPARGGAWWDPSQVTSCSRRSDGYTRYCGVDEVTHWWPLAYGAGVASLPSDWVMVLGSGPRVSLNGGNSENNLTTSWPNSGWLCNPQPGGYRLSGSTGAFAMACMGWSDGYAGRFIACCR